MSFDLIHFPNFRRTFFGTAFQSDMLALLRRVRDDIGCRHILYTFRGGIDGSMKASSSDLTVVMTAPTAWSARYAARNYFTIDPVFQDDAPYFAGDASGIVRDLEQDARACPDIAEMLQEAEKCGLGNCFVGVSARTPKGVAGCTLFSFMLSPDEDRARFVANMRARLLGMSGLIHNAVCGHKDAGAVERLLTQREIDCLRWAANGKTDGEIAEILNIARWTVVSYFQTAKIKLNCSNRTSAVATALSLGIIDMPTVRHLV